MGSFFISTKYYEPLSKLIFNRTQKILSKILGIEDIKSFWRGKKVLDVGCGNCSDVIRLRRRGAEAYGLDLINVSRTPYFIKGNATNMPFAEQTFDIVFSKSFVDLLTKGELEKFIKESYRILKPKGYLIIVCYLTESEATNISTLAKSTGFHHVSQNLENRSGIPLIFRK